MTPAGPRGLDLPALFDLHQKQLLALTLRITGDFGLAEDALQQTFLIAHAAAASFRGDSAPGTWLYRIAAREAMRMRSTRRAEASRLRRFSSTLPEHAADAIDWQERTARMLDALNELPEEQRLALVLLTARELPAQVVGELLGVPPATVYTRAFRARVALRGRMEE